MTKHEMHELAVRLAQELDIDRHKHWNEDGSNRITHLVRAAVAHGLRIGAKKCKEVPGLHGCDRALIRMADEIEAAK